MTFVDELASELRSKPQSHRWMVGIAGIPGSGKSTLASQLAERLPGIAAVVPLDGFHYSNHRLAALGLRAVKGSPPTFDFDAFFETLRSLRSGDRPIQVPLYDRATHEPVPGPIIDPSVRIIITEGNYLLLDQEPWISLSDVLDECWFVDTALDQARLWIINRHVAGGRDFKDAEEHYERNDLPNARLVLNHRRQAAKTIEWPSVL